MAHSLQVQRASYPLAAYNFRVTVDAHALGFSRVTGLQREHQTLKYRHGLSFLEGEQLAKYFIDKFAPVTFERGSVVGARFLRDWLDERSHRVMEVTQCDAAGKPVIAWRIARAIAVKLTAPSFDARTSDSAIEQLEVMAAGISIVHL